VYCFSQKDCETIAEKLNALMVKDKARFKKPPGSREPFALPYHAGIDPGEKEMNQQKWSDGKVPIICTCCAFPKSILTHCLRTRP
jgi:superfamily II DNA helicase RecQ